MLLRMWPLLAANLRRRRTRSALTLASVVVAFLLFGLLSALRYAITGGVELAGADRLMTMHRVSFIQPLPRFYLDRISALPGVRAATSQGWFGGYVQDERRIISAIVVDPETFFQVFPEIVVSDSAQRDWRSMPTGALVGDALARANAWKVGDTIPLQSNIYRKADDSNTFPVVVAGIYRVRQEGGDTSGLFVPYRYFNEARVVARDTIGWISTRVADPARMSVIARQIDALFANSSAETKTGDERAFMQGFVNQIGNIGKLIAAIAMAVFFTMLLVTANTMAQSVRERTGELAVLKTLGFSSGTVMSLVVVESLLLTVLGALLGLFLASTLIGAFRPRIEQYLPLLQVTGGTWSVGLIIAIGLGLLAALLPAWQAWRLRIVDALQRG